MEEQHFGRSTTSARRVEAGAKNARVVRHEEIARTQLGADLGEHAVAQCAVARNHQQARFIAALGGPLRDQRVRQLIIVSGRPEVSPLAAAPSGQGAALVSGALLGASAMVVSAEPL